MMASVLVTGINPKLRELVLAALNDRGIEALAVSSLKQAKQAIAADGPSVLVVDADAAGEDAKAFCQSLRQEGQQIPIILLSSASTEDDVVRGLEAGADDYLAKPFAIGELVARVAGQLRHLRKRGPATVRHLAA